METLFGIDIGTLTGWLTIVFAIAAVLTVYAAVRNPVVLKMAVRNIPRRRAQTALIVLGLMLATLLFSASFATGDTLAYSIRVQALTQIGQMDEVISSTERDASGRRSFIPVETAGRVRDALSDAPVDGVTPVINLTVPAVAAESQRSEPRLGVQGFDASQMAGFDEYADDSGRTLALDALGAREAYLSADAADELRASVGDEVALFFTETPAVVTVAGVIEEGGNGFDLSSAVMRLGDLQEMLGEPGRINGIYVSNTGGTLEGAEHTPAVVAALEDLAEELGLDVDDVKSDVLEDADEAGGAFASIFLLFGTFSIIAGILLIALIFVMLAAERRRELGIARAVGAQRGQLVRLFTFEGAIYSLAAAAVGSVLGLVVGLIMVRIMAAALGALDDFDFEIVFSFRWQSLVLSYTLGMVVTYVVVVLSALQVSVLNIVRAVRDIPEPPGQERRLRGAWKALFVSLADGGRALRRLRVLRTLRLWLLTTPMAVLRLAWATFFAGYLMVLFGLQLVRGGIAQEQLSFFLMGLSLVVVGVPLVLKHAVRLPERVAYTAAGVLLVVLWIGSWDWERLGLPKFDEGIELFILSGTMLVIGAVWVVIYNSPYIVRVLSLIGRGPTLSPIMRTAIAYPMASRFRTGMTLAMFSLVVFTLTVIGFITSAFSAAFDDTRRLSGGFDVAANVSFTNPIDDIEGRIAESGVVALDEFEAIGGTGGLPVRIRQVDTEHELQDWFVTSIDEAYANSVTYGFSLKDERYAEDRDVWRALVDERDVVVVNALMVPSTDEFAFGPGVDFRLEGFKRDDAVLPEVYVEVFDSAEEQTARLRVIGIIEDEAFFANTVITGRETLQQVSSFDLPLLGYQMVLRDPSRASEVVTALEDEFVENGLRANSLEKTIRDTTAVNLAFNQLIQGFMGLGLIVGIAALGVIAARSVVERRVQIGVLRAIGFRRGMVQLSFLIESSFIALLGIAVGLGLGFGLSASIINEIGEGFEGVSYQVPWTTVVLVVVVAYGAALLTTWLPALQASRIYPAEALRLDE